MNYYILDADGNPVLVDLFTYAQWCADNPEGYRIAYTQVSEHVRVSTVFLGLDHDHPGIDLPVFWETMVFGGPLDLDRQRYCTRAEAEEGHKAMVSRVQNYKGSHV